MSGDDRSEEHFRCTRKVRTGDDDLRATGRGSRSRPEACNRRRGNGRPLGVERDAGRGNGEGRASTPDLVAPTHCGEPAVEDCSQDSVSEGRVIELPSGPLIEETGSTALGVEGDGRSHGRPLGVERDPASPGRYRTSRRRRPCCPRSLR